MITSHLVSGFEMVNPAEGLAHRNVTSHKLDGDLQAFHSEFLMAHAIGKIKQLKLLVNSNAPEAKRVSSHLLKTAAIVSQLGGANAAQYQLYQHPRMTASADLK
ncbi:MAG: hypothetical protein JST01_28165 [Cyanobacteria bacterium SZAS TMP-1]|nr:hypothetical protein [Cyanobacteria bacterium SZAS TMP-1]